MNQEELLRIQSYLDGELSEADWGAAHALLERDAESRAMCEELRATQKLLRENEPVAKLGETREFYWSKIERRLEQTPEPARFEIHGAWRNAWRRMLIPLAGASAAVLLLVFTYGRVEKIPPSGIVETASEDMGAFTFRDHKAGITMVWVYNREPSTFTESKAADSFLDE